MDSEYFYEKEAEYFGFTPFQFLDYVGDIVVRQVYSMADEFGPDMLETNVDVLSKGQLESVQCPNVLPDRIVNSVI